MDHLAILSKKLKLLTKIISGEKLIESRWYTYKKPPFKAISINDTVYFKEAGEPVYVRAKVKRVLFYDNLNPSKIKEIISTYGKQIGVDKSYIEKIKDKNLCTLIFLKGIEKIDLFKIDKTGYGMMAAWITVKDIKELKVA